MRSERESRRKRCFTSEVCSEYSGASTPSRLRRKLDARLFTKFMRKWTWALSRRRLMRERTAMHGLEAGEVLTSRASSIWERGDVQGKPAGASGAVGDAALSCSRSRIRRSDPRENSPRVRPLRFFAGKEVCLIGRALWRCHGTITQTQYWWSEPRLQSAPQSQDHRGAAHRGQMETQVSVRSPGPAHAAGAARSRPCRSPTATTSPAHSSKRRE